MRSRKIYQAFVLLFVCFAFPPLSRAQRLEVVLPDDPATVIAVVGRSHVVLGDLLPKADARIAQVLAETGKVIPEKELKIARLGLVRGMLGQLIQTKMMRESFLLEQVGTENADKHQEADAKLTSKARQMFHESEVPELKKQYGSNNLGKLDKILREKGSSLAARQRDFVDQMLGHLYIRGNVDREPRVSLSEIIDEYMTNKDDYYRPTRARWEQLSVVTSNFPDQSSARKAIEEMGREALFGGSMQSVAREKSQEPFASKGGVHEWTSQGSLASAPLDAEVFTIPLNKISGVIKDQQGFHIIRVLERRDADYTPLSEVQDEIRSAVRKTKIEKSQRTALDNMRKKIPVWTLFPEDIPGSKPLPISIAQRYSPANL